MTDDSRNQALLLMRALDRRELAAHRLRAVMGRRLGVRDEELLVLRHLAEHGSATRTALIELTGLSRSGIGALIQRLERVGLVERRADTGDRRVRSVRLTTRSHDHLASVYTELRDAIAELLSPLSSAERATIATFLDAIADRTQQQAHQVLEAPEPLMAASRPRHWALWG